MSGNFVFSETDHEYMRRALALAERGLYTTLPNPAVGCVLVKNGEIIGEGWHHRAGEPHAEVMALRNAAERNQDVKGATAYVTLEPCSHYGRTPPCALGLVNAGIFRVVAAMKDPNPLVSGRGFKILEDAGVCVSWGLYENEARELNRAFLYSIVNGMPYVTIKYGMSLDARVALANGESKWITSEASRHDVQRLRARHQAILTSAATVVRDDPSLNVRWPELPEAVRELFPEDPGITPLRIIADPDNAITLKEKLFQCPGKVFIARTGSSDTVTEERISDSVSVVKVPARKDNPRHISFRHLWSYLDSISIRNVMIEAGRGLVSDVIRQNAANEIVVYMAPKIMGGDAISAFGALGLSSMAEVPELVISDVAAVGTDVRITCRFKEGACLPE